ncbi:hypothetical protein RI129_002139 [Pyrocoelia pectoralis]|uniref:FAM192A/Fyv6 N-terminal domain-containing protein n=1 Tax=Pyrocoelia pectoralis TaxID=417401 RepID=A0AAN7VG34_9COLE
MSSGFITENELAEARKKRQEEWEKVRNADDPIEAPEQPYDPRSLYERLQEQKQRKELEYEEAHKLKNMIKGLDDDEIEFLDLVDRTKIAADRRKNYEEERELTDYRNRVANLQEKSHDQKLQAEIIVNKSKTTVTVNRPSQTKLLKGVIVTNTKRSNSMENNDLSKKPKLDDDSNKNNVESPRKSPKKRSEAVLSDEEAKTNTGLTCIGILPGLGCYADSSSDECSSNSDDDIEESCKKPIKYDLIGRKIVEKDKELVALNATKQRTVT